MLLMVEKGIGGGVCHAIRQYTKANDRYMKDYDKNTGMLITYMVGQYLKSFQ